MLWTIFVILLVLWLLGLVSSYTLGGFIHILLVLALVVLILQLVSGRRSALWQHCKPVRFEPEQTAQFRASNRIQIKFHGGGAMDKDRVKGTIDDAAGRAKRQVGEWTGDTNAQVDGAAQQVKGKAEKVWGNVKDAARDVKADAERQHEKNKAEHAVSGRG
jgi:uncharacterized protein YjbJ (UPF0337 family)